MIKKIRNFIEEYHMVEKEDCVLAAVSGGADSVCLLLLLHTLREELGFSLCAVHVEHGIRGEESLRDVRFVEEICKTYGIPCRICHCRAAEYASEKKLTLEEAARELRYRLFRETAEEFGANKTAVAHNQNDCAETMLFHLARGSGLKGLCGIQPVRGQVIRPLLCVSRQEIERYLTEKGQAFCVDRTNQDVLYTRNKIRHQVLPLLTQINENAVLHMNQAAGVVAEAAELVSRLSAQAAKKYVSSCEDGLCIQQGLLGELPVIQKEVLHHALAEAAGSSKDISNVHVLQLLTLFARQSGKAADFPYGVCARRTYEGLLLVAGNAGDKQAAVWELPVEGKLVLPSYGYEIRTRILQNIPQNEEIPKKIYTKWFDYDKIKGTMRLRTRREQDFLVINREGSRKKLKKYFVDEKIPGYRRDSTLLLADETHILWVIGYRISEDIKVTEHTKRILEIRVNGGKKCE